MDYHIVKVDTIQSMICVLIQGIYTVSIVFFIQFEESDRRAQDIYIMVSREFSCNVSAI